MGPMEKNSEILDLTQANCSQFSEASELVFISDCKGEQVVEGNKDLLAFNIANSLNDITSFDKLTEGGLTDENLDMVLDKVISAISCVSRLQFKVRPFVEPREIDEVKKLLAAERCDTSTKKEIELELTNFQNKITTEYKEKIDKYKSQKVELLGKLDVLENRKAKIVSERLAQFAWPYDAQTRAYDKKIYEYKSLIRAYEFKIEEFQSLRPMAQAKDIEIFQSQLITKFTVQ